MKERERQKGGNRGTLPNKGRRQANSSHRESRLKAPGRIARPEPRNREEGESRQNRDRAKGRFTGDAKRKRQGTEGKPESHRKGKNTQKVETAEKLFTY